MIYPPVCGICGKYNGKSLCKKCEIYLKTQAKFEVEKYKDKLFSEHLYVFKYEGIIREKIIDYKFNEKSYLYKTFVNFLLKNENFIEIIKKYDTIIPVPISKKRYKERGYNQSYLIAKEISKIIQINCNNRNLIKIKNVTEQSKLNKEQRETNTQGVYQLKNEQILKNKKIILLDDIYTTGSTVNSCCEVLQKARPKKIGILTIAKD